MRYLSTAGCKSHGLKTNVWVVRINKKAPELGLFADRTGLEPATSAVTGRHSNQLNYRSVARNFPGVQR